MDSTAGLRRSGRSRLFGKAAVALLLIGLVVAPISALAGSRPKIIPLPTGWQPEGIATRHEGNTFYSGSIADGAIFRGNLKTGEGKIFIPGQSGRVAAGLKVRRGMLFVAGGPTGQAYVFDVDRGREIATLELATPGTSFINDVATTRHAAWFTDSFQQQLYKVPIKDHHRVGTPQMLPLSGDITYVPGQFNANGIDVTAKWLVIVQSITGELFRVNPHTGKAEVIDLGGESVVSGDGILLDEHHRLWVGQNAPAQVTLIRLSHELRSGRVISRTTDKSFDVPTTIAESDGYLAVINARFGIPNPDTAEYWITQIRQPHAHK
jgi:sugar lactone lactonase YvrE